MPKFRTTGEYILLPNSGQYKLVLRVDGQCEFVVWKGAGEDKKWHDKGQQTLAKVREALLTNGLGLSDEFVARVAGHLWTTKAGPDGVTVMDYRTGETRHDQNDTIVSVVQDLMDTLQDLRLEGGYHPQPCLRYHIPHNSATVNWLSRGFSVRCYLTLIEVNGDLVTRFEFGFTTRDAVAPAMEKALKELSIVKP